MANSTKFLGGNVIVEPLTSVGAGLTPPDRINFGPLSYVMPAPVPSTTAVFPQYHYAAAPSRGVSLANIKSGRPNG